MRTFDTGATRDDNANKLDYVRGLSVQVQQRYLEYLSSHRLQRDGSLRDWDNWKKGIDTRAYRESLLRHSEDAVRASMGLPVPEDASLEDLLCAIRFNADGWLFELLVAKSGNRESACVPITDPSRLLPAAAESLKLEGYINGMPVYTQNMDDGVFVADRPRTCGECECGAETRANMGCFRAKEDIK